LKDIKLDNYSLVVNLMDTGRRFPLYKSLDGWRKRDNSEDLLRQTAEFANYVIELNPDVIFFLDKSARPIAHMLLVILRDLLIERPQIRFINIGREARDPTRKSRINPNSIRSVYSKHIKTDGKFLIVDDLVDRGLTLELARALIRQAFPRAQIITYPVYKFQTNWYGALWYLGVRDWTEDDYKERALEAFNKSVRGEYKNPDDIPDSLKPMFDKIYDETLAIPYTRPFKPSATYDGQSTHNYNPATHNIITARRELRLMAETILDKYFNQ
jgi:hypoxanthine phosphoribosyltransferase